jgi:hypothetical protein
MLFLTVAFALPFIDNFFRFSDSTMTQSLEDEVEICVPLRTGV